MGNVDLSLFTAGLQSLVEMFCSMIVNWLLPIILLGLSVYCVFCLFKWVYNYLICGFAGDDNYTPGNSFSKSSISEKIAFDDLQNDDLDNDYVGYDYTGEIDDRREAFQDLIDEINDCEIEGYEYDGRGKRKMGLYIDDEGYIVDKYDRDFDGYTDLSDRGYKYLKSKFYERKSYYYDEIGDTENYKKYAGLYKKYRD